MIPLDPRTHRTYHYWHVFVPGIGAGQAYAYRAYGPFEPENGLRFDPDKVLLDPYGRCVARPPGYNRSAACRKGDNAATALKSVVATRARMTGRTITPRGSRSPGACSTSCTCAASRAIPPPASPRPSAAPTPGWWRRSPTCRTSGSAPWSCCRSMPSTSRTPRRAWSTTGATPPSPSSRPTAATAPSGIRWGPSTSSGTWSRRSTAPASRSSWTWCTTTPRRGARRARPSASGGCRTTPTTSWSGTGPPTPTTPGAATP